VLAHFNKKSLLWNQAGIRRTKRQGAERIILDLRGNPEACSMKVNICNLFVPKNEIIVTTKSKKRNTQ
jgi:carboxyl-terminal processing protease